MVSAGAITCVLPTPPSGSELSFYGTYSLLNVQFVQSGVLSNITAIVYSLPDLPVITSITSTCLVQNSPLTVSSCRAGDVLTISGQHLSPPYGDIVRGLGPLNFATTPVCTLSYYTATNTNTSMRCRFNSFYSSQGFNVSLPYVLADRVSANYVLWQSNPVFVSFVNDTAPYMSNSAPPLSALHGAAAILIVLTASTILCMMM